MVGFLFVVTGWHGGRPNNVSLLALPAYSPELNSVERWFEEFVSLAGLA